MAVVPASADAAVRAGVGEVDASWHVGASAGQYASDGTFASDHGVDPATHSYRRASSYGRQSELKVRAIVVEGADGKRIAVVKNDLYLPGDLLHRRTAQLLEAGGSGVTRETLTMAVTHNHSSPLLLVALGRACGPSRTCSTCASSTTTPASRPRRWRRRRRR